MKHIFKCTLCNTYTLLQLCPSCNAVAVSPRPARFTLDKLSKYRLPEKKRRWKELGWV